MARGIPTGACMEWHAFVGILQILHQGREMFEAMTLLSWTSYISLRQRDQEELTEKRQEASLAIIRALEEKIAALEHQLKEINTSKADRLLQRF